MRVGVGSDAMERCRWSGATLLARCGTAKPYIRLRRRALRDLCHAVPVRPGARLVCGQPPVRCGQVLGLVGLARLTSFDLCRKQRL